MATRQVEMLHKKHLEDIFSKSGLLCQRPYVESEESSDESEEWFDIVDSEKPSSTKPIEELLEEEETATTARGEGFLQAESSGLTPEEEGPGIPIFPTPSLALYRPQRLKNIHEQNVIHVLPDEFNKEIDASKIPKIGKHHQKYIATLAELVGCTRYESSLTEYWFLDTLAHLLSRAQADHLPKTTQAILIHWFCEWMQEMRHFDMADRKRMMARFKENMLLVAEYIAVEERLPTPRDIGVDFKEVWAAPTYPKATATGPTLMKSAASSAKHGVKFDPTGFECCMRDMATIIHYIYDLFSTDYQYDLVRSIFTFRPEYKLVDASFQLRLPKKGYMPLKPLKPLKSPLKKTTPESKPVKKGMVMVIKKVDDTPEFLHLMEIKAAEEKELELKMEQDREEWNKRSSILPLAMSLDDNFLDKYWPPPPPEPEEDLVDNPSDIKKKSKKKK